MTSRGSETVGRGGPRLFRERNVLLVFLRYRTAIARGHRAALDRFVDLLLPGHLLSGLLFLGAGVLVGRGSRLVGRGGRLVGRGGRVVGCGRGSLRRGRRRCS